MKRILIIAYYFPPAGGAGVQRTVKFVKYLPGYGWIPDVLTVHMRYYRLCDETISSEVSTDIAMHTTSSLQIPTWLPWRLRNMAARWLLLVDEQLGWYPFAIQKGNRLLQNGDIEAIYSTSPPYTDHLIGYSLKKSSSLPWVADFRDPWVGNFARQLPTRFHKGLDHKLEKLVIHHADRVIVVSDEMRSELLARYHDIPGDKVVVITNGFDSADFERAKPVVYSQERMTIVYTGSFYSRELTPQNFLMGLELAIASGRIPRSRIQVFLVGNIGRLAIDMVNKSNISELIHVTGYLPHEESIAHLINADLLLLIIGSSSSSKAVLTGKLFEYLAAGKPILALVPPGAAASMIQDTRSGVVVHPDNIQNISDTLVEMYALWLQNDLIIYPDQDLIEKYDRRSLTAKLASLLEIITSQKDAPAV